MDDAEVVRCCERVRNLQPKRHHLFYGQRSFGRQEICGAAIAVPAHGDVRLTVLTDTSGVDVGDVGMEVEAPKREALVVESLDRARVIEADIENLQRDVSVELVLASAIHSREAADANWVADRVAVHD